MTDRDIQYTRLFASLERRGVEPSVAARVSKAYVANGVAASARMSPELLTRLPELNVDYRDAHDVAIQTGVRSVSRLDVVAHPHAVARAFSK